MKVAEEVRDLLKTRVPRFELDLCGTVSSNSLPSRGASGDWFHDCAARQKISERVKQLTRNEENQV
jgi:hypothetical protein